MFSVPGCLSRKGGWFLGSQAQDRKGIRPCEPGWGACIDVSLPGCDAVRRNRHDVGEVLFRDGEVFIDDKGLRIVAQGEATEGWSHVLASARRASAHAQECDDSLSVASTHVEAHLEDEAADGAHAGRSPSLCPIFRRTCTADSDFGESRSLLHHAHVEGKRVPGTAARTRNGNNHTSVSVLGNRPAPHNKSGALTHADRLFKKISPGERALPKLTDAFPESGGGCAQTTRRASTHPCSGVDASALWSGEEVAWNDHEAMKAKYAAVTAAAAAGWSKQSRKMEVKFRNIEKVRKIGKGNTSVVWQCRDSATQRPLAMKEVLVDKDEQRTKMLLREMVTIYGVDHVGVVTCHNVFFANNSFHLVMELMDGGSLLDAMRRWCCLDKTYQMTPVVLAKVARDVLSALEFLHDNLQVVHRDVKPGNILLHTDGTAKLADLGIVTCPGQVQVRPKAIEPPHTHAHSPSPALCGGGCLTPATPAVEWIGTVTYMSPERLTGDAYSFSADIWSLGIVLLEAAVGQYPLTMLGLASGKLEFWDLLDIVRNGECAANVLQSYGSEWVSLQAFAAACLIKDPTKRPCASMLLDASFPGVCAGGGDFFLDYANPNGQAALAEWVKISLIRGGGGGEGGGRVGGARVCADGGDTVSSPHRGVAEEEADAAGSSACSNMCSSLEHAHAAQGMSNKMHGASNLAGNMVTTTYQGVEQAGLVEEVGLENDGWV